MRRLVAALALLVAAPAFAQVAPTVPYVSGQSEFSVGALNQTIQSVNSALSTVLTQTTISNAGGAIAQDTNGLRVLRSPNSLPKWHAALAKVKAGLSNSTVLIIGDSTAIGINGAGVATGSNFGRQLATLLNSSGFVTNENGFWGWSTGLGNTGGRTTTTDTRFSSMGGWSNAAIYTAGGMILTQTSASGALSYTPLSSVDKFTVWTTTSGGLGTVNLQAGTGTVVPLNETGAGTIVSTTVTADALGSKALTAQWASGGTVFLLGVDAYSSAQKSVQIVNAGWWGSSASGWSANSQFYSAPNAIQAIAPDLTIIDLGINDWGSSVTLAAFQTAFTSLIAKAQLSGDVVVLAPAPNNNNTDLQASYMAWLKTYCLQNNLSYVGWWDAMNGSYATANGLGLMSDTVHPNQAGYADQAQMLAQALLSR